NDTAPINLPPIYTGLPLIPLATLVRFALPPILARIMSCLGPHMFFEIPMISIGTGSGSVPEKTVHAVAFIPGLISLSLRISTLPALGRAGELSAQYRGNALAATTIATAIWMFIEVVTPVDSIVPPAKEAP